MQRKIDQSLIIKATKHLKASDKALSNLIKKHGKCTLKPTVENPFHALVSSIISQQISAGAARAIKGRLFAMLDAEQFTPEGILNIQHINFKTAGLSSAKQEYIRGIALKIQNGEINLNSIAEGEDDHIISQLVALPGVGRWTAEMFLIFGLGRPDILSVGDAGLKRGFKLTYGLQQNPTASEMTLISEPWRPYRSVASWYIWRVVD
jgi:DNA-3-methyladenine glycosylase II